MPSNQNLPMRSIPQELSSRTSVFAVCFCFLFSIAPHFTNLPIWVVVMVLVALGWRALQNLGKLPEIPKWMLIPLVLFGGIGVFAEYWTIVGRDAGLALLTVMTSFKFLESKRHRDMLILVFLCYFLIATHFLYSQSILTAAMMFVTLIIITATLITLNQRDDSVSWRERLLGSARLLLLSVPLMLILFVLVPRVPGPLWGLQSEQRGGVTGLSDHMSPGEISNLIRSNEVAFRVDFAGAVPAQNRLYWRGPVMAAYSGYRWSQVPRKALHRLDIITNEPAIEYTVTLEPNGEHWLLALDIPTRIIRDSVMTEDFQLTSKKKVNDLLRYSMQSRLAYQVGLDESPEYLEFTREYPERMNPQTIEFGKSLAQRLERPEDMVSEVLTMFREQEYIYTLQPPALGSNSVDEFLFDTRRGFCEHYAGAFALIMRAAGIPARVVTGYQGGEFNRVGNYLIVRQSDAHAWTEIWIENRGWLRVDPTAAVSPSRIEQGLDDALSDEGSIFRIQNRNPIFGNLLYSWDNLQHSWNDWVLNYDQRKQRDFLSKLKMGIDNWSDMVFALVVMLLLVTASIWLVVWYRERPPRPQAYEILFNRLLKKLARRGLRKDPAEDSRAFLQRLSERDLPQRDQLARIIELYNRVKYGRQGPSAAALDNLRSMINSIN
ncbi:MAG: DUF3488 and transglutaminase-like domain-containing protein [Gammaproteobacteria bacterium]|nr:DUF3488 and transglutaminase-like domain-containing protein [Gammaproteobacteria bacterium]MDH3447382.1 DUF3488 and transglutaminase-like domain-containing protein [Gammaproteobacteria bacterium]